MNEKILSAPFDLVSAAADSGAQAEVEAEAFLKEEEEEEEELQDDLAAAAEALICMAFCSSTLSPTKSITVFVQSRPRGCVLCTLRIEPGPDSEFDDDTEEFIAVDYCCCCCMFHLDLLLSVDFARLKINITGTCPVRVRVL